MTLRISLSFLSTTERLIAGSSKARRSFSGCHRCCAAYSESIRGCRSRLRRIGRSQQRLPGRGDRTSLSAPASRRISSRFQNWRMVRFVPDRIERDACAGLAAIAFDLKPAEDAVDALAHWWRGLSRATADGPCLSMISLSGRFQGPLRAYSASILAALMRPPQMILPGFGNVIRHYGVLCAGWQYHL